MPLTDLTCRSALPRAKPYKVSDGGGLYLLMTPAGSKLWRFKYRFNKLERSLSIGPYPLVTLREAREQRDEAKRLLLKFVDPASEKAAQKRRSFDMSETTFEKIAKDWFDRSSRHWTPKHATTINTRLSQDIIPYLGKLPIADIKPRDILNMIRSIEDRGAFEIAKRCLSYTHSICRHAVISDVIQSNPAIHLKGAVTSVPRGHYAAIDSPELPGFLMQLGNGQDRMSALTMLAIELLMLTFVRTGELIKAQWNEFDFDQKIWRLDASRMKMKRNHLVPLSAQSITVLKCIRGLHSNQTWVFPGNSKPHAHMSSNTVLGAIARIGYRGKMTGHGFRALAMSTIMERLGFRYDVVDRQLAHAPRGEVRGAYDRAQYIDERVQMMQSWADYLDTQGNAEVLNIYSWLDVDHGLETGYERYSA